MSEEYVSIFQNPTQEQLRPMYDWLAKHVGIKGDGWQVSVAEAMCVQLTFDEYKHKRMFDFYAEMQGMVVYNTLKEYRTAQMIKFRSKVDWMDDT